MWSFRSAALVAVILTTVLPSTSARSQSLCLPTVGVMSRLADPQDIVLDEPYAYVADGSAGLVILDISIPSDPVQKAAVFVPHAEHVAVHDGFAFLTDRESLHIIDVSRPGAPRAVGRFRTGGRSQALAVADGIAYISAGYGAPWSGLKIIDVRDPGHPREIGGYKFSDFSASLTLRGSHLFVARSREGLTILDVYEPSAPREVGRYETWGGVESIAISGDLALVAAGGSSVATGGVLVLIDVSDVSRPVEVSRYHLPDGHAERVAVSGDLVALTVFDDITLVYNTQLIDISDPEQPILLCDCGLAFFGASPLAIEVSGGLAFVAAWVDGLRVVDLSSPATPELIGELNPPPIRATTCHHGHAYSFGYHSDLLEVAAVPASGDPYRIGAYRASGDITDFEISGELAYVAVGNQGVVVLDAATPGALTELGTVVPSIPAAQIKVSGTTLYVMSGDAIEIIDITNPADSELRGRFEFELVHQGELGPMAATDETLYVGVVQWGGASRNQLWIIDVREPEHPSLASVAELPSWSVRDIEIVDDTALVAVDWLGVLVFDVARADAPALLGVYELPLTAGVSEQISVFDGMALVGVADGSHAHPSLLVMDVTNPTHPVVRGGAFHGMDTRSLSLMDGRACLLLDHSQLVILDPARQHVCSPPRRPSSRTSPTVSPVARAARSNRYR